MTMNQGIIFLPYIMAQSPPIIVDSNFATKMLVKSRYKLTSVNSNYYGAIQIEDYVLTERRKKLEKIINRINGQK